MKKTSQKEHRLAHRLLAIFNGLERHLPLFFFRAVGIVGLCFGLWIGGMTSPVSAGNEANVCSDKMKRGVWKDAAACFLALVDAIPNNNSDPFLRRQKALYLQYVARSYAAYAKMQEGLPQRAYYYELAAKQLHRYLNEKLCDKLYQCRHARGLLQENESSIGYATLVMAGGDQPVRVEITGFETKISLAVDKQSSQRLRPGSYQLQITSTGQPPSEKSITLSPGQTKLLQVGRVAVVERRTPVPPPPPPSSAPVGAYVLIAVGGGLALIGVGMGIGSIVRGGTLAPQIEAEKSLLDGSQTNQNDPVARRRIDALVGEHDAMEVVNLAGWIGAGVGGALLLSGVIWLLAHPKPSPTLANRSSHGLQENARIPVVSRDVAGDAFKQSTARSVVLWRSSVDGRSF